jgi:hypothetical protein
MPLSNNSKVNYNRKVVLALSIPQCILITAVSCVGLSMPGLYSQETLNWQVQSLGQDTVDLFVVTPSLVITAIYAWKNNKIGWLLWSGVNLYLIYTFVIYCFDVHFNRLFILYSVTLGLSFYSFAYFLYWEIKKPIVPAPTKKPITRIIAVYLLGISLIFYFLWLTEIIPAIMNNVRPKTLIDSGLTTNPVHVIDLAILLPGIFLVAILILVNQALGLVLVAPLLVFMFLMDITIAVLMIAMKRNGFEGDYVLISAMAVLALFSLGLLIGYLRDLTFVPT